MDGDGRYIELVHPSSPRKKMGDLGWDLMVAATFQRFERGPVSESLSWFCSRFVNSSWFMVGVSNE